MPTSSRSLHIHKGFLKRFFTLGREHLRKFYLLKLEGVPSKARKYPQPNTLVVHTLPFKTARYRTPLNYSTMSQYFIRFIATQRSTKFNSSKLCQPYASGGLAGCITMKKKLEKECMHV